MGQRVGMAELLHSFHMLGKLACPPALTCLQFEVLLSPDSEIIGNDAATFHFEKLNPALQMGEI